MRTFFQKKYTNQMKGENRLLVPVIRHLNHPKNQTNMWEIKNPISLCKIRVMS